MRNGLRLLQGKRSVFTATFGRYGTYGFCKGLRSLLLRNVCHQGKFICEHLWVENNSELSLAGIRPRDVVRFSAVVEPYIKSVGDGHGTDFTLGDIKRVEIIHRPESKEAA